MKVFHKKILEYYVWEGGDYIYMQSPIEPETFFWLPYYFLELEDDLKTWIQAVYEGEIKPLGVPKKHLDMKYLDKKHFFVELRIESDEIIH